MSEEQYESAYEQQPDHGYGAPGVPAHLASRWARLGAALLDVVFAMLIVVPIMFATGVIDQIVERVKAGDQGLDLRMTAMLFVVGWAVFFALHGYLLYTYGQTLGKRIVGTKIIDPEGNVPSFGKLIGMRYLLPGLISNVPFVGSIFAIVNACMIFRANKRCLHDDFANTYVVDA